MVVDPTWDGGVAYLGIPFRTDYLRRSLLKADTFSLLDPGSGIFPLLSADAKPEEYTASQPGWNILR